MSSEYTLSNYVSLIRGTTYKGDLVNLPGPVLLGLASIQSDGGFRWGAFKTYGGECPAKITLKSGDLYVSLKDVTQSGDLLGSVARVPKQIKSGRLTQDTVKLELSGRAINPSYLYWMLRTPQYREYCRSRATGTTTLGLAREDFLAFPIADPKPEQDSLVELLEGIEERIELLAETNVTLEAIAQALFKSWFVDFDPVHANAGTQTPSLPPEIQALFPATFTDSPQGPIPEGWKAGQIGDVISIKGGYAFKSSDFQDSGSPVIKIKNIVGDGTVDCSDVQRVSESVASKAQRFILNSGDILMAMTGATIGKVGIYVSEANQTALLNQRVAKFENKNTDEKNTWLAFIAFSNSFMTEQIVNAASGSAQPNISSSGIESAKLVVPADKNVLKAFNSIVDPIFQSWISNQKTVRLLSDLRDTLLPRLISGQLRLPEAEQAIAAITD